MANNEFMRNRDVYKSKGWTGAHRSVLGVAKEKSRPANTKKLYYQGISFKNPLGPLHPIEQRTLDLVKYGKIQKNNMWTVRKPLWYDVIRERTSMKLNTKKEVSPLYTELSLGAAETPTTDSTATTKNFWGALTNLVTTGAGLYEKELESKIVRTQAQIQAQEAAARTRRGVPSQAMSYAPWILGIGGGALLLTTLMKKRGVI